MQKVYVLLEKFLETGFVRVEGVFETRALASSVMNDLMTAFEEERAYKIEEKTIEW